MGGKKKMKAKDLRPDRVSETDLKALQEIVTAINKMQFDIGTMEVQKHNFMHAITQANEKMGEMQVDFADRYGTSNINIQTGAIDRDE
jgi:hypothetical protein